MNCLRQELSLTKAAAQLRRNVRKHD